MLTEPAGGHCQSGDEEVAVNADTPDRDAESFVAVVRHGDLITAAASIGVAKGWLKRRVHALSARMEEELLIFDNDRVMLTQAGERCYRHLVAPDVRRSEPAAAPEALTLAMPAILMETVFCRPLLSWLRKHRGSRITLLSEERRDEADIRLWVSQGNESDAWCDLFRARRLATLNMVPCVGARFSSPHWHRADQIEHCRLGQYDAYAGWAGLRPWNERIARSHAVIHVHTPEMYVRAIKWLGCLGVLPERTCRHDPDLKALPLPLPEKLELDIWLGYRTEALLRPEGRTLWRMITEIIRESGG